MFGFKVIRQYEKGIVLHWGKAQDQPRDRVWPGRTRSPTACTR
jgi:hypothetical protein